MSISIKLPAKAAKYISLQRLETQALGKAIHYSSFGKMVYFIYERIPFSKRAYRFYSVNIEPRLRSKKIVTDYSEIMNGEFETIKNHMPETPKSIIGIGPGVAGLEVLMSHHYKTKKVSEPEIILIDKTGLDPIHFGFHETAAVYNSLDLAKEALVVNGHSSESVLAIDAEQADELKKTHAGKVDLVTSLIAWGFHFPVETYLELVKTLLADKGRLIIDVRKETNGREILEGAFSDVSVIFDDPKFERVLAIK